MEHQFLQSGLASWKNVVSRLDKLFDPLSDEELQKQVAPGKNRLFYLLGHLTAVHDRMLPLLSVGERLHPELDEVYIVNPDRTFPDPVSGAELKQAWRQTNTALTGGLEKFTAEDWLRRHTAVSEEDFRKDPSRNRFAVLLNRTSHAAFHTGQIILTR
jgi:hypothetical protein